MRLLPLITIIITIIITITIYRTTEPTPDDRLYEEQSGNAG
ncbi:MAG: hypothetical protein ABSA09_07720 [Desulfobaccales bacterium]|jgi:hypothetical protein